MAADNPDSVKLRELADWLETQGWHAATRELRSIADRIDFTGRHFLTLEDNGDGSVTFTVNGEVAAVMPGTLEEIADAEHVVWVEGGPDGR